MVLYSCSSKQQPYLCFRRLFMTNLLRLCSPLWPCLFACQAPHLDSLPLSSNNLISPRPSLKAILGEMAAGPVYSAVHNKWLLQFGQWDGGLPLLTVASTLSLWELLFPVSCVSYQRLFIQLQTYLFTTPARWDLGEWSLNMRGTKVSSNSPLYSLILWGLRGVTWVKSPITAQAKCAGKLRAARTSFPIGVYKQIAIARCN